MDVHHGYVRYLGAGHCVICLHHTGIQPYRVTLPPPVVRVAQQDQTSWLQEEVKGLTEVRKRLWG